MSKPMVYIVTSFDFGGNSNVVIHVVTEQRELAESMYTTIETQASIENSKNNSPESSKMLVELTCIPKDVGLYQGATLFWGKHAIMNNTKA